MNTAQRPFRVITYAPARLQGTRADRQPADIRLERLAHPGWSAACFARCRPTTTAGRAPRRPPMVPAKLDVKGTQILAKTLFKELRGSGYTPNQILGLSTELIDLVTKDLKADQESHLSAVENRSG